jgi:hypothetical protein
VPLRARRGPWIAVLAACVLAAGAKSIALGKDANWDLKNYHWYNAWALLNGRLGWDLAPAQIQTYYNPIGDLPFYFLVQWLPWPRHVAFWMALSTAVAVFFLVRTAALLFPVGRERGALAWIAAASAIGATGAAGQATVGSTMNEWLCAAPLMAGLFLVVRALVEGEDAHRRSFAVAAFLVGCAVGLKLTYAVFGLAFLAALATCGPPHVPLLGGTLRMRAHRVVVAGAFMALGTLAFGGYWAWVMWREFANPTFPYYNHVFHSPWWEPVAFFDRNYGPRDMLQAIFFPIYFSHRSTLVSEVGFRDYRLAALMVLGLLCLAKALLLPSREKAGMRVEWRFLAVFTVVAYLIWLKLFGIYRYLVPLELLSGPLIVGCLVYLVRGRGIRYLAVAVLGSLLLGTTRPMSWGRIPFGHEHFEVKVPQLAPGALVIVGYSHPMSYVIPFFPADARFVSPANNFLMPDQGNRLAKRAAQLIREHRGPIYLLEYSARVGQDVATLRHFGLAFDAAACEGIRSTFSDNFMQVCRLSRS